jgi:branched-chain amino acid transport system ATP-binding protein
MKTLLQLDDVHSGHGPGEVLKGINLTVRESEIVAVLGANGAGKSTMLMTICGVNHTRQGCILFGGKPIQNLQPHEIVRRGISQVPEGRRIFPRLTVRENLEMGAYHHPPDLTLGKDLDPAQSGMEMAFDTFPILRERQRQLGGTLSGGEQQMLAISRALMARPRLLLLDEPSLGLAPLIVARIFDMIHEINRRGMTILLVEQNASMALHIAQRGYVLENGQIAFEDSAANLMNSAEVKRSYLGG